jgi:hypothetical protein
MNRKDGIVDASGRWLAPLQANESLPAMPARLCAHGTLCKACAKS